MKLLKELNMKQDIHHPEHYTWLPKGIEAIDVCEALPFNRGNVVKYLLRAGKKKDELEDLQKAAWYLNREIENLQKGIEK